MNSYRIIGLDPVPFAHLAGLDDGALARHGAQRYLVDALGAFPDRIEMRDLEPGEAAILLNYLHQPAETPYRSRGPIFVREGATERYHAVNAVPEVMRIRPLSLRAFDVQQMMVDADLVDGESVETLIERLFENPNVAYIAAHYAKRGCFAARIERADANYSLF